MSQATQLRLDQITADPEVQQRVQTSEETAQEYTQALQRGEKLHGKYGRDYPVCFCDGSVYWLADGFTRLRAHQIAGRKTIEVEVIAGGRRDAILYAISANLIHGSSAKPADRKRAALTLLRDPEWRREMSDREIARRVGISPSTVGAYWKEVQDEGRAASVQIGQSEGEATEVGGEQIAAKRGKVEAWFRKGLPLLTGFGPESERAVELIEQARKLIEEAFAAWE